MENLILPKQYKSELNLHDTQLAIKTVKDFFQALLAQRLHLTRVSAPLFVDPATGLNDNLMPYPKLHMESLRSRTIKMPKLSILSQNGNVTP